MLGEINVNWRSSRVAGDMLAIFGPAMSGSA